MTTIVGILLAVVVVLWSWAKWQTVRAQRLTDGHWEVQSSLRPDQLHELVTRGVKGFNPLAHVAQPERGVYQRWVTRGVGKRSRNRALLSVAVVHPEGTPVGELVVRCGIPEWQGPGFLGIRSVSAVLACGRRVKSIVRALQTADPSCIVLADPARPELMAPTTGA